MKYLAAVLLMLLVLLQYRLWFGQGGMREVGRLRAEIAEQRDENATLRERNRTLAAEVQDLKKGTIAIEERARTDLGMIGKSETFFQVVKDDKRPKTTAADDEGATHAAPEEHQAADDPGEGIVEQEEGRAVPATPSRGTSDAPLSVYAANRGGVSALRPSTDAGTIRPARERQPDLPTRAVAPELMLIGRTTDEVRDLVEKYLDDAFMAGVAHVRLVHGKGTGALRKAVRGVLSDHPLVASFRDGEPAEGGAGATVAVLKVS